MSKNSHIFIKLVIILFVFTSINIEAKQYLNHHRHNNNLTINSDEGQLTIKFYTPEAVEVFFQPPSIKQLPSYAIDPALARSSIKPFKLSLRDNPDHLMFSSKQLTVRINKQPLQLSYYKNGELLASEESGLFVLDNIRGVRFNLAKDEKILGGGERVLGMNRRGQRLPLYNRAHYGYTTKSEQMNFSLPAIMSDKKYLILFDNSAKGFLDIGKSEAGILQFEAVAGRSAYLFFAGASYPKLIENYVTVTGKQPMPPRWALGNFASRFGYHSEQEAREVVKQFQQQDIPLDAIIFDLYWFGKDLKGYMGNLAWDHDAFPTPVKMISDFKQQGIKTLVITEPFILTNSSKYQDAVKNNALALNLAGKAKTFDFYFGNTALVDVFSEQGQNWFWQYYEKLLAQGVAAWWGDLGEPEVHPADTLHSVGSADEIHNVYGHKWAEMIFTKQLQSYPDKRPFLLMRSGFAGSQRFGMIPWTGDVSRSWGGLKPQVELSLQMGLFGLAYTHSDLGGFAGDKQDDELYIRWLQYGVFQPIYRPHAQESVPSEPIFYREKVKNIVRRFIKLRYQLLPYNYTLAYQNSTTGMPLMRPVFFENEQNTSLIDVKNSYLWGDAFFVSPVTDASINQQKVKLPQGVWFNYFNEQKYQGGKNVTIAVNIETIPVFVRAGAFVPTIAAIQSTKNYSSKQLNIDYYADASVTQSNYQMYDDDGKTYQAQQRGLFELLNFSAKQSQEQLTIHLSRQLHKTYQNMPTQREILLTVHNWLKKPAQIIFNKQKLADSSSLAQLKTANSGLYFDEKTKQLTVKFTWQKKQSLLFIN
jgi:oligosaccharide 4-alpha-D-glucosyltransferase